MLPLGVEWTRLDWSGLESSGWQKGVGGGGVEAEGGEPDNRRIKTPVSKWTQVPQKVEVDAERELKFGLEDSELERGQRSETRRLPDNRQHEHQDKQMKQQSQKQKQKLLESHRIPIAMRRSSQIAASSIQLQGAGNQMANVGQ
ncbi:GM12530 [Drosophila sechellia]|uniref:GM12530 n=1 Tax=Drosophila sechellia TaxID=7238 RepID=B4I054_DROSE|nr:GM12530 [Drosophila sechellia]